MVLVSTIQACITQTPFQVTQLNPTNSTGASSEKWLPAYAAFANGGIYHKPIYINKIVFSDGSEKNFLMLVHEL